MFTSALIRPFTSARSRTRNRVILVTVCILSIIGATVAHAFLSINTDYLRISTKADRSNSRALGSSAIAGNVYIYLSYKDPAIKSVNYHLNPSGSLTSQNLYATRTVAPYDLAGTLNGQAQPFNTSSLKQGQNLLVTKITLQSGYIHHDFTWFNVAAPTVVTTPPTTVAPTTRPPVTAAPTTRPPTTTPPTTPTTRPPATGGQQVTSGNKCSLGLHGAGGGGASYGPVDDVLSLNPQARNPANGSTTNFWLYDGPHDFQNDAGAAVDEQYYQYLVNYIRQTLDARGCGPTFIAGSSSGGAFAAKLYCRGETFGNRVWGYTMEDPVKDDGVLNCRPSANTKIAFFQYSQEHERESAAGAPSFRCSRPGSSFWYCENDKTMTGAEYQRQTGQPSLMTSYLHWSADRSNYLYQTSDGINRYETLPWRFPAEVWRTCWNAGRCDRSNFLP